MPTRHPFGLMSGDYVVTVGDNGQAVLTSGAVLTFWDSQTGGTQYTDITTDAAGTNPAGSVTSQDGTGTLARGTWDTIYGPPDVLDMWVSANDGARVYIITRDTTDLVATALAGVDFGANYGAKGDVLGGTGPGAVLALPVGSDGQVLAADSSTANGLVWKDPGFVAQPVSWLVVDGTTVREGVGGPIYRATGYNSYTMRSDGDVAAQTFTAAQRDAFFASLRANSLVRVWCFNPASGLTQAAALTQMDAIVASAKKYGHRLVFGLTDWAGNANDAYGVKSQAWFNAHTWRTSVTPTNSLQAWATTVATRYAGEPTVAIYDVMNEPQDGSAAFTADLATYVSEMSGYIKAVAPNALVYMSAQQFDVGGWTALQTITASADILSIHDYDSYGYDQILKYLHSNTPGKPILVDEWGTVAKGNYGASGDADSDPMGLPPVSFAARRALMAENLRSTMAYPDVFGMLYWSAKPDSGWQTGAGTFELTPGDGGAALIHDADLAGSRFVYDTDAGLAMWQSMEFAWRNKQGYQVGGADVAMTQIPERIAGYTNQPTAAAAPTVDHKTAAGYPSLMFNGAQNYPAWDWNVSGGGSNKVSYVAVIYPTALTASAKHYLYTPSTPTNGAPCLRIDGTTGHVELIVYGSANTAATTIALTINTLHLIEMYWNGTTGAYELWLDGVKQASGTSVKTFASDAALIGSVPGGTSGYKGAIVEHLGFNNALALSARLPLIAYLTKKYNLQF